MLANLQENPRFSWYPGHMLKAERELKKSLQLVNFVIEVVDARAPDSTRNRRLNSLINTKPRILVLNKQDIADKDVTCNWVKSFSTRKITCLASEKSTGRSSKRLLSILTKKARENRHLNQVGNRPVKPLRGMIIGMPNVGKSTIINQLVCKRKAATGPFPGVTRHQQWIKLTEEIELLDTPGVTMPKINSLEMGLTLIALSVISDKLAPSEVVAEYLYDVLRDTNSEDITHSYGIKECPSSISSFLATICKRRGIFKSGGVIDTSRGSKCFINDFRKGKLGTISFERPENKKEDTMLS